MPRTVLPHSGSTRTAQESRIDLSSKQAQAPFSGIRPFKKDFELTKNSWQELPGRTCRCGTGCGFHHRVYAILPRPVVKTEGAARCRVRAWVRQTDHRGNDANEMAERGRLERSSEVPVADGTGSSGGKMRVAREQAVRPGDMESRKSTYGSPDREGHNRRCWWSEPFEEMVGRDAIGPGRKERRDQARYGGRSGVGGVDDGEHRNGFEAMCFGDESEKAIARVWVELQSSSPSGAAFMVDTRLGMCMRVTVTPGFQGIFRP
ncbi:hypothetical protein B0H13DRAFT_1874500 [Mycena leptocephala]|nr:hypothetical protein B0H13DRAFT_1874500 [Mycena leptocephala]